MNHSKKKRPMKYSNYIETIPYFPLVSKVMQFIIMPGPFPLPSKKITTSQLKMENEQHTHSP